MPDVMFLYTTWPDAEKAEAAGRAAVEAQLAACVNILAPMRSIYRWRGKIETDAETPMTLKTTAQAAGALKRLLIGLHPYETPCILALPVSSEHSHTDFLAWVQEEACGEAAERGAEPG
jgi:periplasmic divalent cation tolerance protein